MRKAAVPAPRLDPVRAGRAGLAAGMVDVYGRQVLHVTDIFTRAAEAVRGEQTLEAQARAGLRAGWMAVTEDQRKARIVAIEVVGVSERLETLRRQTRHALAQLTADEALKLAGGLPVRLDPVIVTRFLMGGVVELLADWVNGDLHTSTDEVVEHFTTLFTASAYAALAPGTG